MYSWDTQVIAGLWVLSIVGTWCNFLTLFYIGNKTMPLSLSFPYSWYFDYVLTTSFHSICFILWKTAFVALHTVPVLYEKYEVQIDSFAEKAMVEFKKQWAVFDARVLSKIPRGLSKDKKKV